MTTDQRRMVSQGLLLKAQCDQHTIALGAFEQILAEAWGIAYTDATREELKALIVEINHAIVFPEGGHRN